MGRVLAPAWALVVIACSSSAPPLTPAVSAGDESTNGDLHFGCTTITRADVEALHARMSATSIGAEVSLQDAERALIERRIAQRLAPSVHVEIAEAEIDQTLNNFLTLQGVTIETLEGMLSARRTTLEAYRDELRAELRVDRVGLAILVVPTQTELDAEVDRRLVGVAPNVDRAPVEREAFVALEVQAMHEAYAARAREWRAVPVQWSGGTCVER